MEPDEIQIFITGIEGKTTTIEIHKDATVGRILELLSKKINIPVEGSRLLYLSKELQSNKCLSYYGIEKRSTLFHVSRLRGGPEEIRVNVLDPTVELSDVPDMITWNDDPENKRVKMPGQSGQGHVINPPSSSDIIHHPLPMYFRVKPVLDIPRLKRCPKSRTVFTDLQLRVLERTFAEQRYLDSTYRAKLSQILGLNEAQVKTWFQNRRMKWKRTVAKCDKPDSSTTSKTAEKNDAAMGRNNKEAAKND